MSSVRMTTSPTQATDSPEGHTLGRRGEPHRVVGVEGAEADRRRSLNEELKDGKVYLLVSPADNVAEAGQVDLIKATTAEPPPDIHAVIEALGRLGAEASRLLRPINAREIQRILFGHVDELA